MFKFTKVFIFFSFFGCGFLFANEHNKVRRHSIFDFRSESFPKKPNLDRRLTLYNPGMNLTPGDPNKTYVEIVIDPQIMGSRIFGSTMSERLTEAVEDNRRQERWKNSSWVKKPFYAVSYVVRDGVRKGRVVARKAVETMNDYNKKYEENTFFKPQYVLPTLAAVTLANGAYQALKRKHKDEDLSFVFQDKNGFGVAANATRLLTVFFQGTKGLGLGKLNSAFLAIFKCLTHKDDLLEYAIKDKFIYSQYEPHFQKSWSFLLRSIFLDQKVMDIIPLWGPEHIPFLIDLIYPIYQVWRLSGHMIPQVKDYLTYNMIRYIVKYYAFKNSMSLKQITKLLDAVLQGAELNFVNDVSQKVLRKAKSCIREGAICEAVDTIMNSVLGKKGREVHLIQSYAKNLLRKVDFSLSEEHYVVAIEPEGFKTAGDVLSYMLKVAETLGQYREDLNTQKNAWKLKKILNEVDAAA